MKKGFWRTLSFFDITGERRFGINKDLEN